MLWIVTDKWGRIYWQAGKRSWIPDKYINDPQYIIRQLKEIR